MGWTMSRAPSQREGCRLSGQTTIPCLPTVRRLPCATTAPPQRPGAPLRSSQWALPASVEISGLRALPRVHPGPGSTSDIRNLSAPTEPCAGSAGPDGVHGAPRVVAGDVPVDSAPNRLGAGREAPCAAACSAPGLSLPRLGVEVERGALPDLRPPLGTDTAHCEWSRGSRTRAYACQEKPVVVEEPAPGPLSHVGVQVPLGILVAIPLLQNQVRSLVLVCAPSVRGRRLTHGARGCCCCCCCTGRC